VQHVELEQQRFLLLDVAQVDREVARDRRAPFAKAVRGEEQRTDLPVGGALEDASVQRAVRFDQRIALEQFPLFRDHVLAPPPALERGIRRLRAARTARATSLARSVLARRERRQSRTEYPTSKKPRIVTLARLMLHLFPG
jgi:hypothetical protein